MVFTWYHGLLIGSVMFIASLVGYGLLRYYLPDFFETCRYTRPRNNEETIYKHAEGKVTVSNSTLV